MEKINYPHLQPSYTRPFLIPSSPKPNSEYSVGSHSTTSPTNSTTAPVSLARPTRIWTQQISHSTLDSPTNPQPNPLASPNDCFRSRFNSKHQLDTFMAGERDFVTPWNHNLHQDLDHDKFKFDSPKNESTLRFESQLDQVYERNDALELEKTLEKQRNNDHDLHLEKSEKKDALGQSQKSEKTRDSLQNTRKQLENQSPKVSKQSRHFRNSPTSSIQSYAQKFEQLHPRKPESPKKPVEQQWAKLLRQNSSSSSIDTVEESELNIESFARDLDDRLKQILTADSKANSSMDSIESDMQFTPHSGMVSTQITPNHSFVDNQFETSSHRIEKRMNSFVSKINASPIAKLLREKAQKQEALLKARSGIRRPHWRYMECFLRLHGKIKFFFEDEISDGDIEEIEKQLSEKKSDSSSHNSFASSISFSNSHLIESNSNIPTTTNHTTTNHTTTNHQMKPQDNFIHVEYNSSNHDESDENVKQTEKPNESNTQSQASQDVVEGMNEKTCTD